MTSDYLENVTKPGQTVNPLFASLGVEVALLTAEKVILKLGFRPEFIQGGGVVAGGMLATLADEAMAHVVLANMEEGRKTATIEMSVRYFRPVLKSAVTAVASLVNKGKRIVSAEAVMTDAQERLVAKASASFFVID